MHPPGRCRRLALTLVATAIATGACRTGNRSPPVPGALVQVTRVTDGDTLRVKYAGRDERLRLIGIDTPEVPWYGGQGECFGAEAGLYTRGRLSGRSVRLEFDRDRRDRFDRLLAYVYLEQELFNLTLVRLGFARADPVTPNTGRSEIFASAESEASGAGRGLWSACPTVP